MTYYNNSFHTLFTIEKHEQRISLARFSAPERCRLRLISYPRGAHPAQRAFLIHRKQYFYALQQQGLSYESKKDALRSKTSHMITCCSYCGSQISQFIRHIHTIKRRGLPIPNAHRFCNQFFALSGSQKGNIRTQ